MAGCACVVIVDMQFIQNQYQSLEEAYTEISNGREMDLNMMQQVFEAELHATAQYQGKPPPPAVACRIGIPACPHALTQIVHGSNRGAFSHC